MDFEKEDNIKPDDLVSEYSLASGGSFRLVCDPKSLLYLFGMQLDWSPALGVWWSCWGRGGFAASLQCSA